jgi:glutamine cyclotransferase
VPARLVPVVEEVLPHDPEAFTQGYVLEDGRLFESAGKYGESTLREVDPATGEVVRVVENDPDVFAEGLELVGDRLIQLTWREETAFVWDADSFELIDSFTYAGEGWGLCDDGSRLVMSDGSASLTFRDRDTFAELGDVAVTLGEVAIERLNELECVGGLLFANVWLTTDIVVIDPESGEVVAVIDASLLRDQAAALAFGDFEVNVLNGIAYDEITDRFHLTGKYWPVSFVVRFESG